MKILNSKCIAGLIGLGFCVTFSSPSNAWYGSPYEPYYGPSYHGKYGPEAMKRDRKNLMSDHAEAMANLKAIIEGRKSFDRLEATRLAREIEAGSGENLWRLYSPASVDASGSRTAASIWGNYETFKANANALKQTAAALADAIEKRPTAADIEEGVWVPPRSVGYGNTWGQRGGDMSNEAIAEYTRLKRICTVCHLDFRTSSYSRW